MNPDEVDMKNEDPEVVPEKEAVEESVEPVEEEAEPVEEEPVKEKTTVEAIIEEAQPVEETKEVVEVSSQDQLPAAADEVIQSPAEVVLEEPLVEEINSEE